MNLIKTYAPLLILTMLAFAGCSRSGSRGISVLSYNIRHGEGADGRFDLERIAAVITRLKPDIVALQEVDSCTGRSGGIDQAARLGQLTGMHAVFGKAMDYDGGGYGEAVLSAHPFQQIRAHILPAEAGHEPRCALSVRVQIGREPFLFIGTHLDHTDGHGDRIRQAGAINRIFQGASLPAILAGDLNDTPDGPALAVFWEMWHDASAADPQPTFPADQPDRRIDYILFTPQTAWQTVRSAVIPEVTASDHRPLLSVLRLTSAKGVSGE